MSLSTLVRKSLWSFRNIRRVAQEQSVFKVVFTLLFVAGLELGLWVLFRESFQFLDRLGGIGLIIVHRLFALFFFGLALMMVLSGAVAAYTGVYRSDEMPFLLMRPITLGDIMLYKSAESALLSSWAFFLIIIPFVGAYAAHEALSPLFMLWTVLFSVPFVALCSGIGFMICLALVRYLPRGRVLAVVLGGAALLMIAGWWQYGSGSGGDVEEGALVLSRIVPGIEMASHPLWPSWWVAEGIMALSQDQVGRGIMLWLLLMANALALGVVVEIGGVSLFRVGWKKVTDSESRRRARPLSLGSLDRAMGFLAPETRGIIIKDLRVFLRDPAQWSQGIIFFGLLALYFLNLRNLRYDLLPDQWRNVITFLNIFGVSAVMCSFGTRFIYPLPSLEGHGFWVVGMSPVPMARVIRVKFGWALTVMMLISVGLMLLSAGMLRMDGEVLVAAVGIAAGMALAITGLSTGLGTIYMDLRESNPAAIISGFGGTLNLVLSLCCMLAVIIPFGVLFHSYFLGHVSPGSLRRGLVIGMAWTGALSVMAGLLPLHFARKSLLAREY